MDSEFDHEFMDTNPEEMIDVVFDAYIRSIGEGYITPATIFNFPLACEIVLRVKLKLNNSRIN
ncbi:MAG: hypothetical protein JJE17_03100 [Peptostreptococcaceae bacterium]|nr:hypothetical protein [Peptostreptococcaceae bacterium]